jgi:hypothetical protein
VENQPDSHQRRYQHPQQDTQDKRADKDVPCHRPPATQGLEPAKGSPGHGLTLGQVGFRQTYDFIHRHLLQNCHKGGLSSEPDLTGFGNLSGLQSQTFWTQIFTDDTKIKEKSVFIYVHFLWNNKSQ